MKCVKALRNGALSGFGHNSCRAVVTRARNGLATVIWPIAALAGREWPGNRIETALFPEPFRGSEAAVNPGARAVGATAPRGPCKARAFALQRACNRAARPTRAIGGQILWQVPNPISSPLSRYPVRLPSASRAAGGGRCGFHGAEFDAIEDRRQGGSQRPVEDAVEGAIPIARGTRPGHARGCGDRARARRRSSSRAWAGQGSCACPARPNVCLPRYRPHRPGSRCGAHLHRACREA